ncbi:FAD-binding and (Fe-S)-binding domain-containing protein [Marinimicrobium sp. ABcell2]|uniref:FAD-binding and (Fe-S)-binding domain-containing protein n=1 Tax=Marinimicrobium sp. ABcell2 TaxID=3069751 RepID=UPI0027B42036|nr:FAD-binding and (Fe-S)-binding domain-containing protein [Marinimicrobium sp. ABcell2]MDQ2075373.1 FAD-linked oxidase C-terminal domain-containing protein [Marinimicrobium sp. ABcell2]
MASPNPQHSNDKAQDLANRLRACVRGEVRFDDGSRALYAADGSLYRQVPIGLVVPRSVDDVVATLRLCREADVPVLARGAGTSLAGQACNVAVVIDFSKYLNQLLEVDPKTRRARVQPGCVLDVLRNKAEEHHLTFAPDPSTHAHNTLGGMIGNNSCGVHSVMAGRTADNVITMEVLTYDGERMCVGPTSEEELEHIIDQGGRRGEIYAGLRRIRDRYAELIRKRYPDIPRRVSGYNLDELLPEKGFNVARALVGSEGTCVTCLEAELQLVPSPPVRVLLILSYPNVYVVGDHVPEILKFEPTGLEGMDSVLLRAMAMKQMHAQERRLLPEGGGWLMVEFGGETLEKAKEKARAVMDDLCERDDAPTMELFESSEDQERLWKLRESGLGATSRAPEQGNTYPGWEDAAVPPENVGRYLREFRDLMHRHNYEGALYGHFGEGCIHCRINFDLRSDAGLKQWRRFMIDAADLVLRYGGSLSGEHGDGQVRAELLPRMYGEELAQAFREFKSLWDPAGKMNPGKVVDPYPMDTNLRYGPDAHPPIVETEFDYPEDHHSFADATNRCVGIGNCRDQKGGVMCPSYRGTGEEQHSTRGRARLLFEMLRDEELREGWRNESVHEALDLCLACKGCKSDCPVNVDMATFKAEFMAHYYRRRLHPRDAYAMGLIWWWSRAAGKLPGLANFVLQTPGLSGAAKWIGGISPERAMPKYAKQSFRDWFQGREKQPRNGKSGNGHWKEVVLWPDTFNNYFYPDTLKAAVRVLEAAKYRVRIPARPLCCSRPLFAEGMLDLARKQLHDILETLQEEMTLGLPLIGLEPSCVASFRDELPQLFPKHEGAHYLAENSQLLGEFLQCKGFRPPPLSRRALVHTHCHQHASLDGSSDARLLAWMGVDAHVLDAGCCGLAGSFGFKASNHELSLRIGEQHLMPAVRAAEEDTLLITNGFSCREQIRHATGRRSMNIAEVLDMALREGQTPGPILASSEQSIHRHP